MSVSAEDIATIIEALPNVTVESPLPAFEQLAGGDVNFANVGGNLNLPFGEDAISTGDINLPFGQDALDISITDDNHKDFDFLNPSIDIKPA